MEELRESCFRGGANYYTLIKDCTNFAHCNTMICKRVPRCKTNVIRNSKVEIKKE